MDRLSLPKDLINKVLMYLSEQPYRETCGLISELQNNAEPVEAKKDKPLKLQEVGTETKKEEDGKSQNG